jgi:nucleotide-binding universal stress UspA family protein
MNSRRKVVSPTQHPVLVATDLSARSDRAVDRAVFLAEQWGVRLKVVHVFEAEPWSELDYTRIGEAAVRAVLPDPTKDVDILLLDGSAPTAIVKAAKENECGLIVTGVARHNNLGDYITGTAVDHIVRHASQPVLIVKQRSREPYRSVVVATDFSDCSGEALVAAAGLFPDAMFHLVHAYHVPYAGWLDDEETREEFKQIAEKEMDVFLERCNLPESVQERVRPEFVYGGPGTAVLRAVKQIAPDLVVLGTHGRGSLAHATIGSTASHLLRNLRVDTLMVRGN